MSLFTQAQTEQLLANCDAQVERMENDQPDIDFQPVVKLFTPDAQCTWLLAELGRDDIAFGLCDLGLGCPELGYVSLTELRIVRANSASRSSATCTSKLTSRSPPAPTRHVLTVASSRDGRFRAPRNRGARFGNNCRCRF
jgi:hypothetical protein